MFNQAQVKRILVSLRHAATLALQAVTSVDQYTAADSLQQQQAASRLFVRRQRVSCRDVVFLRSFRRYDADVNPLMSSTHPLYTPASFFLHDTRGVTFLCKANPHCNSHF